MKRPLFWASLCAVAGIVSGLFLQSVKTMTAGFLLAGVVALSHVLHTFPTITVCLPVCFLLGASYGTLYAQAETRYADAMLDKKEIEASGGEVREAWFIAYPEGLSGRFGVLAYCGNDIPSADAVVVLQGPFVKIEGPANDGEWNAAAYYRSLGVTVAASGYRIVGRGESGIREKIAGFRARIKERIALLFPESLQGIVSGILCGDRDAMEPSEEERFRELGMAHILAVSGMHVAALGGALYYLFSRFQRKSYARLTTSAGLLVYGWVTGFPPSCVRAVLCYLFVSFGIVVRRTADRITSVTFVMAVMLIRRPTLCLQSGFLLSFVCAYAILLLMRMETYREKSLCGREPDSFKDRLLKKVGKAFRFTIFLQFLLMPAQIALFHKISPYGFVLNAAFVPMISIIFVSAAAGILASGIALSVGKFISGPAYFGLRMLHGMSLRVRKLPFAVVVTGFPRWYSLVFYTATALLVLLLVLKKSRLSTVIAAAAFLCFIPIHSGALKIANLSVGQGDCCVIMKGPACIVIDCGSTSRSKVGERVLQPFLEYHGYDEPSAVFVTHTDADHVNGLNALLSEKWESAELVFPITEADSDFVSEIPVRSERIHTVAGGDTLKVPCGFLSDALEITVLWPCGETGSENRNDGNLVLRLSDRYGEAVFAADSDAEILECLAERYGSATLRAGYLKVAHHGSVHSLSEEFYEAVHPEVSVISCGRNNYGHPSPLVAEALRRTGAGVYITQTSGQVTVSFTRGGIFVTSYLSGEGK